VRGGEGEGGGQGGEMTQIMYARVNKKIIIIKKKRSAWLEVVCFYLVSLVWQCWFPLWELGIIITVSRLPPPIFLSLGLLYEAPNG
jgi:hypothetical protein